MIQGTGSSVGKSILVAALCRVFRQDGFSVAPYKSQNMSLNSYVTRDGGEMGRAQVVQAEAAGIEPSVDMNPILLKPEADARSQVVLMGKPAKTVPASRYYRITPDLLKAAEESLNRLRSKYDIVVIEGAGSPAEINLKRCEIVNMRIAKMANAPVLLVGDIDKGGVFAQLVGTLALLDDDEKPYVKGFIINKFRGDVSLLKPGLDELESITSLPIVGVVPYYHDIFIDEEDSVRHDTPQNKSTDIDIAVIDGITSLVRRCLIHIRVLPSRCAPVQKSSRCTSRSCSVTLQRARWRILSPITREMTSRRHWLIQRVISGGNAPLPSVYSPAGSLPKSKATRPEPMESATTAMTSATFFRVILKIAQESLPSTGSSGSGTSSRCAMSSSPIPVLILYREVNVGKSSSPRNR